jgi:protein-glutamine gamma-glutamyltransferase
LMLRSMNVPTRLVIGFRPSEYNDLGGYFQVSQNHAHVWVEAYFTANEIREAEESVRASVMLPPWVTRGVWLRLDPTPPVNGSNAGGTLRVSSTQTLDAMQDLWNEMVINMDKSKQGGLFSLFGESSEGSYANFYLQIQSLLTRMQDSRFVGGFLSPDRWFSWRVAVGVFLFGLLLFGAWKILPTLMPTWMQRRLRGSGLQRHRVRSRIEFYEKVSKQLRRLGFQRAVSQTPQEYLGWVDSTIRRAGLQLDMPVIAEAFYAKRFGEKQELSPEQLSVIEAVVQRLDEVLGSSELRSGIKSQITQAV